MFETIYIVEGFGPGPDASPLTLPARFRTSTAARRHACLIGLFCNEVRISARSDNRWSTVSTASGQEKARMGDSGF